MRKVCAAYSVAALVALSFSVNACGKSNSPNTPTSPLASAQPGSGPASGVSTGTTITGTIIGGSGAASMRSASGLRPMSVGLTVTIVGTSMTVSIDGAGNFQFQNVPNGDDVLEIRGPGVDALAPLAGVAANQRIRLTIVVNGGVADIDENEVEMEGNRVEVEGRISAVNAAGLTITIGTTVVSVPAGTPIRHDGNTELFSALRRRSGPRPRGDGRQRGDGERRDQERSGTAAGNQPGATTTRTRAKPRVDLREGGHVSDADVHGLGKRCRPTPARSSGRRARRS